MQVMLKIVTSDKGEAYSKYILHVQEDDGTPINDILVADLSRTGGGMSMEKWKLSTRKKDTGKRVVGVYFWANIMGHDLDQWRYYDLDSGKDVT